MSDHSKLVAAPAELRLGELTIYIAPLSDMDMCELNEWVRARYIANADKAGRISGETAWKQMMTFAMDRAMELTWTAPPGSRLMATEEGIVQLVWQCCKRHTPGLTREQIWTAMLDPKNIAMFHERFARHNSVPISKEVQPGKVTRPTRRRNGTPASTERRASRTKR